MSHLNILGLLMAFLPMQSRPANVELAEPWVEATYGFSVRPPKGWVLTQTRSLGQREATLLQMNDPQRSLFPPELLVKFVSMPQETSLDRLMEDWRFGLSSQFGDTDMQETRLVRIAGRPGCRFVATFSREGQSVALLQAAVQLSPTNFLVLVHTGLAAQRGDAERVFDAVLESLRLLEDENSDARARKAVSVGKSWLRSARRADLDAKRRPPVCLALKLNGRECGYLHVVEEPFTFQRADGVRVAERGWIFADDGKVRRHEADLFLSFDHVTESWQNRIVTLVPAREDRQPALAQVWEEGIRDGDVLVAARSYQYGQRPDNQPSLRLPLEGYAPRLLVRWLPRLVDLSKSETYGFSSYDHARHALVLKTVETRGKVTPPGLSAEGPLFLVIEREGLSGPPIELICDAEGRLVRSTAGPLTMMPTDAAAVEARWAPRIEATVAQMRQLDEQIEKSMQRFRGNP
ncbi:MAG: hypothetical protein HUU22_04590 [Phycisphaerae bacterium]|nr:hypothetical protein [Phycisphaerae bacterium]NUQ45291.1 hypothetical protein [Phycisphaerae bacterium]